MVAGNLELSNLTITEDRESGTIEVIGGPSPFIFLQFLNAPPNVEAEEKLWEWYE